MLVLPINQIILVRLQHHNFSRDESAYLLEPMCSSISDFLQTPKAPSTFPIKRIKSCGQVMTNLEISTAIEKREKEKKSNKQGLYT